MHMESKFPIIYPETLLRAAIFADAEANSALRREHIDITFTQYRILRTIGDGTSVPVAIAHQLAVSHPAMSRHLKNLEAAKLITRAVNENVRREHHIELTKKGAALRKEAEQVIAKHLRKTFTSISPSARMSALTTLEKTIAACAHIE